MNKPKIIDYTKMELGTVARTYKGRPTVIVARCPKCQKRGARSLSVPDPKQGAKGHPYIYVEHVVEIKRWGDHLASVLGGSYGYVKEHCSISVNAENKDEVLGAAERRQYDDWLARLQAYVAQY